MLQQVEGGRLNIANKNKDLRYFGPVLATIGQYSRVVVCIVTLQREGSGIKHAS